MHGVYIPTVTFQTVPASENLIFKKKGGVIDISGLINVNIYL